MSAPRLALIGTGKMGRAVRASAEQLGWPVVAELGRATPITRASLAGADVAVEFTAPGAAAANVRACLAAGCPVVVGTTGWDAERPAVEREVAAGGGAMLWAPNFSIGVNIFWQVAEYAAGLVARLPRAALDAHILETHHAAKKDAPSGTARELARRVDAALGREVPVTSVRVGSVPGTHELLFDGAYEQLRLEHVARERRVFAEGALVAAGWLAEQWGAGRRGVFTMSDILNPRETGA